MAKSEAQLQAVSEAAVLHQSRAEELSKRVREQEQTVKEAREAAVKAHLDQGLVQSMRAEVTRLRDQLSATQARLSSTATSADETLGETERGGA